MSKNLQTQTSFGLMWTGISQFLTQTFRFIVIVILARLLLPEDFGTVGLAIIFTGFINTVNELGMSAAIIQRKNVSEIHLSTSFWSSVGMGFLLCILTILVSPYVAGFFHEDLVKPILLVSSSGFIIGSFAVVHKATFEKSLNFKKITIIEICSSFVTGIVSIVLAIYGQGVWSLVFGTLSGNLTSTVLYWNINNWRPSFTFSRTHFKELFGFGSFNTGSRIFNYIASNTDYIIVGKLLGVVLLGYYTLAYNLVTFPLQRVSVIVMRVTFPAFSKIQDNNEILKKGYLKVIKYTSLITFPMLAGMFAVAPEFITVLYGVKWIPMIIPLQILCIAGALKSIGAIVGTIQYSIGRADIQFKWQLFTAIIMPAALIIGVNYGITGVAGAVAIMTIFLVLVIQYITNKLIDLDMFSYLKEIFPATISSLIIIISVIILKKIIYFYDIPQKYVLLISVFFGLLIYIIFMRIFYSDLLNELKSIIQEMRG
jgi:O-antigen/teichoic acid export membrane protein